MPPHTQPRRQCWWQTCARASRPRAGGARAPTSSGCGWGWFGWGRGEGLLAATGPEHCGFTSQVWSRPRRGDRPRSRAADDHGGRRGSARRGGGRRTAALTLSSASRPSYSARARARSSLPPPLHTHTTTHTTNAYHTTCHLPHPPATTTTSPLSRDGAGGASGRQTSGHGDKGRGGWCKAGPASRHRDCPIARVGLRPLAQPVMLMDRPLPRRPEGGCS